MKKLALSMIFCASIILQGCDTTPNTSVLVKGPLRLWGFYSPDKPIDYCAGHVGDREDANGIEKLPEVAIELQCGNVLLSDLTPALLFKLAAQNRRPEDYPFIYSTALSRYGQDSYAFSMLNIKGNYACSFIFTSEKILEVEFDYHAVLLDRKQAKRYPFPITYEQAVELFGEPDKTYNIYVLRL